jgi:hypothetical protein
LVSAIDDYDASQAAVKIATGVSASQRLHGDIKIESGYVQA